MQALLGVLADREEFWPRIDELLLTYWLKVKATQGRAVLPSHTTSDEQQLTQGLPANGAAVPADTNSDADHDAADMSDSGKEDVQATSEDSASSDSEIELPSIPDDEHLAYFSLVHLLARICCEGLQEHASGADVRASMMSSITDHVDTAQSAPLLLKCAIAVSACTGSCSRTEARVSFNSAFVNRDLTTGGKHAHEALRHAAMYVCLRRAKGNFCACTRALVRHISAAPPAILHHPVLRTGDAWAQQLYVLAAAGRRVAGVARLSTLTSPNAQISIGTESDCAVILNVKSRFHVSVSAARSQLLHQASAFIGLLQHSDAAVVLFTEAASAWVNNGRLPHVRGPRWLLCKAQLDAAHATSFSVDLSQELAHYQCHDQCIVVVLFVLPGKS